MKKKLIIGGVALIAGLCLIFGVVQIFNNNKSRDIVIVEGEDEEVPLADEIPSAAMTQDELNQLLQTELAKCPEAVLTSLYADGWKIVLTEENLSDKYFQGIYSTVNAVTDSTIKTIWIANTQRAIEKSTLHEIGHYLDWKFGIINTSSEFQKIYADEKANFKLVSGSSAYAKTSSQEYFGEAFHQCIINPDGMMQNNPKTYAFIMAMVNQLSEQ